MNIYTPAGWLDAPHIEEVADRNNISFIVIIGKRQIGKTYNVLKLMLDEHKTFILLRGVKTEMDEQTIGRVAEIFFFLASWCHMAPPMC
jgi:hypothetical protein